MLTHVGFGCNNLLLFGCFAFMLSRKVRGRADDKKEMGEGERRRCTVTVKVYGGHGSKCFL